MIAFSFAGEQRERVRAIAEAVEQRLGRGTVFLDEWYEYYIAGSDADLKLRDIYCTNSDLVVYCVSREFAAKPWTRAEHRAIRERRLQIDASNNDKDRERILPLRVGDGDVPGLEFTAIAPDVRRKSVAQTAELILSRLNHIIPGVVSVRSAATEQSVYLAKGTHDLEDTTTPVNRGRLAAFLDDLGWSVLPRVNGYQSELEADLQQCRAFVQLLERTPHPSGLDRLQNSAAAALGLPRYRFRSPDLDVRAVDTAHREFLTAPDVITSGFEDFKFHLKSALTVLAQLRNREYAVAADYSAAGAHAVPPESASIEAAVPPLVLVAIRAENPDPLWEQVFNTLYEQQQITLYQLKPGETVEAKHKGEPCQGFLIVCDKTTLEDARRSPREDMEQCRVIQLREKTADRRPPVGLVYWPPPAPSWPKLLQSMPVKLHRIVGDVLVNLEAFVEDVRRVGR